jgi:hypothetical protein
VNILELAVSSAFLVWERAREVAVDNGLTTTGILVDLRLIFEHLGLITRPQCTPSSPRACGKLEPHTDGIRATDRAELDFF